MCEVLGREVLVGVGLDLEPHGLDGWDFGVEAKPQTETESAQVKGFARQPGERLVQPFHNGLDRPETLDDAAEGWTPVAEGDEGNYRFFKVGVAMP